MSGADTESGDRTCRSCDRVYKYPALRSQATRFYCEECAVLPPGVRGIFEVQNKRIRTLAAALEKLQSGDAKRRNL